MKGDGSGVGMKEDGMLISPSAGFVIRTSLSSNMISSRKIGNFGEKSSEFAEVSKQWIKDEGKGPLMIEISPSKRETPLPRSIDTKENKDRLSFNTRMRLTV